MPPLDENEAVYLADRLSPPVFQIAFFFWVFLPLFGAAMARVTWAVWGTPAYTVAAAILVAGLCLLYLPFVGALRRVGAANAPPDEVVVWEGTARRASAADGHVDPSIGAHRVVLPIGWEARVFAAPGPLRVRGVRAPVPDAPVYVLTLNDRDAVRVEVPLGLHRYDAAMYYFVLAGLAMGANLVVSPACGLVGAGADGHLLAVLTAVCLGYGAWVMRRNGRISAAIAAAYD